MKIRRALVSVSDKTGLGDLIRALAGFGAEIISTGGTAKLIRSMGFQVKDVSEYTGFGEMLDGRVKTLHPIVHAGILADRSSEKHMEEMKKRGIPFIDMVVVDLYPFEKTVSRPDVTFEEAVENIDIGGPTMIRAAAKNFRHVAAVSSPAQYSEIISEMETSEGGLSDKTLLKLASSVFAVTSRYDSRIASYLSSFVRDGSASSGLPKEISFDLNKVIDLRYGENPHQRGAFYGAPGIPSGWVTKDALLQGKELSFNNILDLGAALEIVMDFDAPAAAVVKHNNPSGAAEDKTIEKAFLGALDCDRMSAFGGIIGLNRPVSGKFASEIIEQTGFFECIIAPGYEEEALRVLSGKKNVRVVKYSPEDVKISPAGYDIKKISGGFLVQDRDSGKFLPEEIKTVTKVSPTREQMSSLMFAWKICRFVKSNAIVLASGTKTVGIGAGQMSRVDSVDVAITKAGEKAGSSVMASDAFFPKTDSVHKAHQAGIKAIIQPGGSIRDKEVIDACDEYGMAMVFTSRRHFRH